MNRNVAILGAGVSGLSCGVLFAERGYRTAIFAKEIGQQTTSSVAAAIWFPYHVEPAERVIPLALETYQVLLDLARFTESGVSIIESRQLSRTGEIEIPDWAIPLGAQHLSSVATGLWPVQDRVQRGGCSFRSGFSLRVPLMDTTIYLDYLATRFLNAGGEINANVHFKNLE
jgi:D-amino-acid oxidase